MNLLVIDTSPRGEASASREVSKYLVSKLADRTSKLTTRDLTKNPLPHVTGAVVEAAFTPEEMRTEDHKSALRTSDEVIDEVIEADAIVISTPMWNFGLPSVLKAWFDHLSRAGRTFSYSSDGPKGLLDPNKQVFFILSSGSKFSSGPFAAWDFVVPSFKSVFGFLGIPNVEIIRVEGTNHQIGRDTAVQVAKEQIDQILNEQRITA